MNSDEKKPDTQPTPGHHRAGEREPETTPDQERGERLDTGKAIARGGKEEGSVPGAEPAPPK